MNGVVIPAAGNGSRTGLKQNKLFYVLDGEPIIRRTVRIFTAHPRIDLVCVVVRAGELDAMRALLGDGVMLIPGGATRGESVLHGLEALEGKAENVLIHDGARPFTDEATVTRVLDGIAPGTGCVAGVPVTDTLHEVGENGRVTASPDRCGYWAAQTPQGFVLREILEAYRACGTDYTDDAAVYAAHGGKVNMTESSYANKKITTREDLKTMPLFLSGIGYDVHRLVEGRKLILGGVDVPYEKGLDGHSDADVLIHAVMDALLGAAGLGDIGRLFPDSDDAYKGVSSMKLLHIVAEKLREENVEAVNVSAVVAAQKPKLAPFIPKMRKNIARVLGLPDERVNVAATTTEHLGFEGRGEGISAQATATVRR